jgi:hypothetical protein
VLGCPDDNCLYFFVILLYYSRYGGERYETRDLQARVRQRFAQLQAKDEQEGQVPWHVVNAARSMEEVEQEIQQIVARTIDMVQNYNSSCCDGGDGGDDDNTSGKPLQVLWQPSSIFRNGNGSTSTLSVDNKENLR